MLIIEAGLNCVKGIDLGWFVKKSDGPKSVAIIIF